MSIQAFRKALCQLPLSQQERDMLTTDELFVLVLARRLDRLTTAEQQKLRSADLQRLASAGLIAGRGATHSPDRPKLSPDGPVTAADGWKAGQNLDKRGPVA